MKRERSKLIPIILVAVAVIIVLVVLFFLVVRPTINGYIVEAQTQGYQYAVYTLMTQASQCQPVPVFFGNQNMSLIWIDCLKPK